MRIDCNQNLVRKGVLPPGVLRVQSPDGDLKYSPTTNGQLPRRSHDSDSPKPDKQDCARLPSADLDTAAAETRRTDSAAELVPTLKFQVAGGGCS